MSFKDLLCQSSQTFDFAFGIAFSGLLVLVFVSIIVVAVLCVDNRRRKRIYKHKYQKSLTKELASAKDLNRILTYMAYKLKNGQLMLSLKNVKPPQNSVALLTDTGMDEHRNRAAANIVYFFAAEPRTKTVVVASPPSTTPIGSPKPSPGTASPQQSYAVSPRQQPVLISSITTTGPESTTSIQSRDSIPIEAQKSPKEKPKSHITSSKQSLIIGSPRQSSLVSQQQSSPIGLSNVSPKQSVRTQIKIEKEEGIQTSMVSRKESFNDGKAANTKNS